MRVFGKRIRLKPNILQYLLITVIVGLLIAVAVITVLVKIVADNLN
jgi:hypothetical protein